MYKSSLEAKKKRLSGVDKQELYHSKSRNQETWISEINCSSQVNNSQTFVLGHQRLVGKALHRQCGGSSSNGNDDRKRVAGILKMIAKCL